MTDDDEIAGARLRVAQGRATKVDRWQISAADRAAQRDAGEAERSMSAAEQKQWTAWVESHLVREWNERVLPEIDGIADATAEALDELRAENRKLQLELAELRGEIRGLRESRQAPQNSSLIGVDGSKLMRPNGRISH